MRLTILIAVAGLMGVASVLQAQTANSRLWVQDANEQYIGDPIPLVFECTGVSGCEYVFELKTRIVPVQDLISVTTVDNRVFFSVPEGGGLTLQPPVPNEGWLDGRMFPVAGSFEWGAPDDSTGTWQFSPTEGFVSYPSSECLSSIPPNFEISMKFRALPMYSSYYCGGESRAPAPQAAAVSGWNDCIIWPTFCMWPRRHLIFGVKACLDGCTCEPVPSGDPTIHWFVEDNSASKPNPYDYRLYGVTAGWRWRVYMVRPDASGILYSRGNVPNGYPVGISYVARNGPAGAGDIFRFRGTNACEPPPTNTCHPCPPMGYMNSQRITGRRWLDHQNRIVVDGYVTFSTGVRSDADIWPYCIESSAGNLWDEIFIVWSRTARGLPFMAPPLGGAHLTVLFWSPSVFFPPFDGYVEPTGDLHTDVLPSPNDNDCGIVPMPCGCRSKAAMNMMLASSCQNLMDSDQDGDIDLDDFLKFQVCFNGPNHPYMSSDCWPLDRDNDWDVDLSDFLDLGACFNGPNMPPAC